MQDELLQLTDKYFKLVCEDHHKDRDCHFYINQVWSYGQKPYYRVEHYGYVNYYLDTTEFPSYIEARTALTTWLKEMVRPENWEKDE